MNPIPQVNPNQGVNPNQEVDPNQEPKKIPFPTNENLKDVRLGKKQKLLFIASGVLERSGSEAAYNIVFQHPNGAQLMLGPLPNKAKNHKETIESRKDSNGNSRTTFFLHINESWELLKSFPRSKAYTKEEWGNVSSHHWIEARDHVELNNEQLHEAADQIHKQLKNQTDAYVHCRAGVGRSAMAVAAYLIKYQGMSVAEASKLIKDRRAKSTIFNKTPSLVEFSAEVNKDNPNFSKEIELVDALVAKSAVYKQNKISQLVDKIAVKAGIKTQANLDKKKIDYEKKQIENFDYQKAKKKYEKKHKNHKLSNDHYYAYENKYFTLKALLDTITEGKKDRDLNFKLNQAEISQITEAFEADPSSEKFISILAQAMKILNTHFDVLSINSFNAIVSNNKKFTELRSSNEIKNKLVKEMIVKSSLISFYGDNSNANLLDKNKINTLYEAFFIEPEHKQLIKNLAKATEILSTIYSNHSQSDHYWFILSNNNNFIKKTQETADYFHANLKINDEKIEEPIAIMGKSIILSILFNDIKEDILQSYLSHKANPNIQIEIKDEYSQKTDFIHSGILNDNDDITTIILKTKQFLENKQKFIKDYFYEIEIED